MFILILSNFDLLYQANYLLILNDSYLTIASSSESIYKEKSSKFLAFAFPIHSEEDFKNQLLVLKKKHHNARHFCYAYKLGLTDENYRYNDDGEPTNSAGIPIYGQILSKQITNVGIIVVRYFGGIKLGVGGLVSAYKTAAKEVLENATIIEKTVQNFYELYFNYEIMAEVMQVVKQNQLHIEKQAFEATCFIKISVWQKEAAHVEGLLKKIDELIFKKV